jgi:hypothetical protein
VDVADLLERYPRLYHMAEAGSWPSIRERGLLSTSALLDLFEVDGDRRTEIESARRPRSVTIDHPLHGTAVIRDQIPLIPTILERCLVGMTPGEWCETLNRRVFFWTEEERLNKLLSARAYRERPHDVLTLDTESLVEAHEEAITLAHLNTGTTVFRAPERGPETFRRIADYPIENHRRVVELAVDGKIDDIEAHTLRVESRIGSTVLATVWER